MYCEAFEITASFFCIQKLTPQVACSQLQKALCNSVLSVALGLSSRPESQSRGCDHLRDTNIYN